MRAWSKTMTAWGVEPFDNDFALQWIRDLDADAAIEVIETPLRNGAAGRAANTVEAGSIAYAAVGVVCAARGAIARHELPDAVNAWIEHQPDAITGIHVKAARAALRSLATNSTLREEWIAGPHGKGWLEATRRLFERLEWSIA